MNYLAEIDENYVKKTYIQEQKLKWATEEILKKRMKKKIQMGSKINNLDKENNDQKRIMHLINNAKEQKRNNKYNRSE